MPNVFRSPNPWVKATAFCAAALTISLGLCGLNAGAFSYLHLGISGPHIPGHDFEENLANALIPTAFLETLAIVVSAAGLVISLFGLLFTYLFTRADRP